MSLKKQKPKKSRKPSKVPEYWFSAEGEERAGERGAVLVPLAMLPPAHQAIPGNLGGRKATIPPKPFLRIELPGLPPTANGSHRNWRAAWSEQQKWKGAAMTAAFAMARLPEPLKRVRLVCTRHSTQKPDRDNLAISFKRVIDGLVAAGVFADDSDEVVTRCDYKWEKAAPGKGRVVVEVYRA